VTDVRASQEGDGLTELVAQPVYGSPSLRRWLVAGAAIVIVLAVLAALNGGRDAGQATINGLVSGTTFALAAVGLALVYGVLRLVNFAHGDMLTFGAYVGLVVNTTVGAPIAVAAVVAVVATAGLAVAGELVLWRPMRGQGAGLFQLLLAAIGLAFVIRNGIQLVAGSEPQRLDVDTTHAIDLVGGIRIGTTQLVVVLVGLVMLAAVAVMLRATRAGREMRALSDNEALAEVTGIDTRRVILVTWAIAGALTGLAGILTAASVGVMTPNLGFTMLLSLFAATVLGGIGSAYGALVGGIVLGLVEEWSTLFVDPRWKLAIGFAVLIATLIARPSGLLGQVTRT
jgi:neutral amino acid transport system permease protein